MWCMQVHPSQGSMEGSLPGTKQGQGCSSHTLYISLPSKIQMDMEIGVCIKPPLRESQGIVNKTTTMYQMHWLVATLNRYPY